MTTNIVERLRRVGFCHENEGCYLLGRAADEIERLRAALQEIIDQDEPWTTAVVEAIARRALEGEAANEIERLRAAEDDLSGRLAAIDNAIFMLHAEIARLAARNAYPCLTEESNF